MRCDEALRQLVTEGRVVYGEPGLTRHLSRCGHCRHEAALVDAEATYFRLALASGEIRPDFTDAVLRLISSAS